MVKRILAAWNVPATIKPRAIKYKTLFSVVHRDFRARCDSCCKQRNGLMPYGVQDWFAPKCVDCRVSELIANSSTFVITPALVELGLPKRLAKMIPTQLILVKSRQYDFHRTVVRMQLSELVMYACTGSEVPIDQRQMEPTQQEGL
ncbi:hypothetical protein GGF32_007469 [Allomyces javanicus]|nr:hypothetical protein GGF32_007469 [Allomyces javanicus]